MSPATDGHRPVKKIRKHIVTLSAPKLSAGSSLDRTEPTRSSAGDAAPVVRPIFGVLKRAPVGTPSMIDLGCIMLIKGFTPRADPGDFSALAKRIQTEGLLAPLLVRPSGTKGRFEVVAGERRYLALKALGRTDPVPCLIRLDLVGHDDRALAAALADNGVGGRSTLTAVEIGHAATRLRDRGWTTLRIVRESGLPERDIRRALSLIEQPEDVQALVSAGRITLDVGLELGMLGSDVRESIKHKLTIETSVDRVRVLGRAEERKQQATRKPAGASAALPQPKVARASRSSSWRKLGEKHALLGELCALLDSASADQIGTPDYHEIRAMIGLLLWDRCDRPTAYMPDLEPSKDSKHYVAQMKDLTGFNAVVKAEAALYRAAHREEE